MAAEIPDGNLFMACRRPVREAFSPLPDGYFLQPPRREELPLWMDLHFDGPETARQYRPYMERYFAQVYAPHGDLFFERCRLLCAPDGEVAGSCFVWKAYGRVSTVHWFKVKREREGRGLGRALLSAVLAPLGEEDLPVCLHTQPGSCRAIKLYSDFGFRLLTDPVIGGRANDLEQSLPFLRKVMPPEAFGRLQFDTAPPALLAAAGSSPVHEF